MRSSAFALCLTLLAVACAGCGRSIPAAATSVTSVQKRVSLVAPPATPLGDDADPGVRIEAVRVAALDPLRAADVARLLQDKDARVRVAAAQVLVALGKYEQDAYPVLVEALGDRQGQDRRAVMEMLRTKAPASRLAAPALIAIAQDPGDPLRIQAIGVLAQLGAAQESVDALLLPAHETEPHARAAALRALAKLDPSSAAGTDLQWLAQSDPAERVRKSARAALQAIVPPLTGR